MLKIDGISSGYGDVTVLHELSFEVKHEIYAILGANGAGKSTLMKTISKILKLKTGEIFFNDENISSLAPYQIAERGLAFVPQEENVFPGMTVLENLSIGAVLHGPKFKKEKLEEIFELFPALAERMNQKAGSLSGGEGQMVAVGRALMQDPKLILLDEPTAGLSPKYVDIFFSKIKEIHNTKGVSIIISEQNAVKAMEIADRIMVLNLGKSHMIKACKECSIDMVKEGYCI